MAFTVAEKNYVSNNALACKTLLGLYAQLIQLDTLWAGTPGYNTSITQADLDTIPNYSGLTTTNVSDAQFCLSAIKTSLANAIAAVTLMANLQS